MNHLNVFSSVTVKGAFGLTSGEFPTPARVGMLHPKDGVLYGYQTIGGISSWYPLTNPTKSHVHVQGEASLQWTVNHQLGNNDCWFQVQDENGNLLFCTREILSADSFRLVFTEPAMGSCVVLSPEGISVPELTASQLHIGNVEVNTSGITVSGSRVLTEAELSTVQEVSLSGDVSGSGTIDAEGNIEIATVLKGDKVASKTLNGAVILNYATDGPYIVGNVTGVTSLTITGIPNDGRAYGVTLELVNAGGNVTFPAGLSWLGTAPTLRPAGVSLVTLITRDGGATWLGSAA